MGKFNISELFIYKWRYFIGYGLVSAALIAVLVFVGLYSPGGITDAEMQSVVKSSSVGFRNIESFTTSNLPYHLLQKASLSIFGVSAVSIKLPSLIIAFFSGIGIILLLKRWFKANIGVLASLIAMTTSQFLFIAQDGTPGILYLFWPVCLLLLASLISRQNRFRTFYKFAFFITAALSLYTPLSIYILIALLGAILLHPHLRYLIRQLSRFKTAIGITLATILLIPLVITIFKNPNFGLEIFGIPSSMPDFSKNLSELGVQYLGFSGSDGSNLITPFFGLGSLLIIIIGLIDTVRNRSSAKSYVILSWIVFLVPVILVNPGYISISFLPMVLLLAAGFDALLDYWYSLFPRNPYARFAGLVPIVMLVAVLVVSGIDRNIYGYKYDPDVAYSFSSDLKLIPADTKHLVVSKSELPFYMVVNKYNQTFNVSTMPPSEDFVATSQAKNNFEGYKIDKIVTNHLSDKSDRLYLYKKI